MQDCHELINIIALAKSNVTIILVVVIIVANIHTHKNNHLMRIKMIV